MTWVEFAGLPAAGKSTAYDNLINIPKINDWEQALIKTVGLKIKKKPIVPYTPDRIVEWLSQVYHRYYYRHQLFDDFLRAYPNTLVPYLESIEQTNRDSNWYFQYLKRRIVRCECVRRSEGLYLVNEGLAQPAIICFEVDQALGNRFLDSIPLPDSVIIFDVAAEISVLRQENRGRRHVHTCKGSRESREAYFQVYREWCQLLAGSLRERGVEVTTIDTTNMSEEETSKNARSAILEAN